jgi:hypothetical protein
MSVQHESTPVPDVGGMELSDAVEAVRSALMLGASRGTGQGVRFEVGEIHMTFTVELQHAGTARGGVKAWVVEAGGERSDTSTRSHSVSLTLRPVDPVSGGYLVIGAPPDGSDSLAYE